jgi:glycosyltransferase involved in cell wall biosynthesis
VSPFFSPLAGGSAIVPHELALKLSNKNNVFIFTTDLYRDNTKFTNEDDIKIIDVPIKWKYNNFYYSPQIRNVIKEYDIDIFHLHNYRTYQNMVISKYAELNDIPVVIQAHGSLNRINDKLFLRRIFDYTYGYNMLHNSQKVIALTRYEKTQYMQMGVNENKIQIIPNGIDLNQYFKTPAPGGFRRKYGIYENNFLILFVGRLDFIKGIDILLHSISNLDPKYDITLAIVGPDGGQLDKLIFLANQLRIPNKVIFTGSLFGLDLLSAYVDSDFIVLPSRYETFPSVVLEAFACSKPVIVSNILSMGDIVSEGNTGLLFTPESILDLTRVISYLLDNPALIKQMGHNAFTIVNKEYDIDIIINDLMKLYESVI